MGGSLRVIVRGRWAIAFLLVVSTTACSTGQPASRPVSSAPACELPATDRAWVERALDAWRFTSREITGVGAMPSFRAIFFSADCVLTSGDALSSASAEGVTWNATPHAGTIPLPDGTEIPTGITSFASGEGGLTYFVMSTPTLWRAGGLADRDSIPLETTMVGVLLHEASHVAQIGPYGQRLAALIDRHSLPDSFNDDALQERFEENPDVAASVKRETELFLAAAAASDDAEARRLAHEARDLMRARQARWLVGDDAYLVEAEDIWLTFEGAGQWAAYRWLVHPRGAALPPDVVLTRFSQGRRWSQIEGFALTLALDRLVGADWKRHAFGDGEKTLLEILEAALAAGTQPPPSSSFFGVGTHDFGGRETSA